MHDVLSDLQPAIILLAAGILSVLATKPLKLSPLVGFIAAGVVLGPYGFDVIDHHAPAVALLAELGVVFLLFDIGLHFSIGRVWTARKLMFGMGGLQMAACTVPITLASHYVYGVPPLPALLTGAALALSSTAVVMQLLNETGRRTCPIGESASAILVFQDMAAIFLLILAEALGEGAAQLGPALGAAALKAALAFGAAILISRTLVTPTFRLLSALNNEDVFSAMALLLVLACAGLSALAGLSLTLGAFLAGMMLADSPYRHAVQAEVRPFRSLLLGFFFITVGIGLNLSVLVSEPLSVLGGLALLTILKLGGVLVVARWMNWTWSGATELTFLMAQASEFALVLFAMPSVADAMGADRAALTIVVATASLASAPIIAMAGRRLSRRFAQRRYDLAKTSDVLLESAAERADGQDAPVAVIGMTPIGRLVADALEATNVPYMATDSTYDRFTKAAADGYPVVFGDMADPRLMEAVGMGDRPGVVVTTKNYEVSSRVSPVIQARYPKLKRFIWVDDDKEAAAFRDLGMTPVVLRSTPHGLELAMAVARWRGADPDKLEKWVRMRQEAALGADADAAADAA